MTTVRIGVSRPPFKRLVTMVHRVQRMKVAVGVSYTYANDVLPILNANLCFLSLVTFLLVSRHY